MKQLVSFLLLIVFCSPSFAGEPKPVTIRNVCAHTPPAGIDPSLYLWGSEDEEAWHGDYKIYHTKKMSFCHGVTLATKSIIYVTPSWDYHVKREEWFYPIRMIDTAAGLLETRSREFATPIRLNGKVLFSDMDESAYFVQAYPEPEGKPQIIILNYIKKGDSDLIPEFYPALRMLDVGVSPPYFSEKFIPFFPPSGFDKRLFEGKGLSEDLTNKMKNYEVPVPEGFKVEKVGEGKYMLSGLSREGDAEGGSSSKETFKRFLYDREMRTVTEIKNVP